MKCLIFFLMALLPTVLCVWTPSTSNHSYSAIQIPEEGYFNRPDRGTRAIVKTPLGAQYYEFCSFAESLQIDCVSYFCSPPQQTINDTTPAYNVSTIAIIHNYCQYCETSHRNSTSFAKFHALVKQGACSGLFVPYPSDRCGSQFNIPWIHSRLYNFSASVSPFICFCSQYDKFDSECDAWTAFFNEFITEGVLIILSVISFAWSLVVFFAILLPEWVLRCRLRHKLARRDFVESCCSIRLQSSYFLQLSLVLCFIETIYFQFYFSRVGAPMRRLPSGFFMVGSFFCMGLSYATMLILWYVRCDTSYSFCFRSNVYIKAQEGSQENNLSLRYRIIVVLFYAIVCVIGIVIIIMYAVRAIPQSFLYAGIGVLVVIFFFIFPFGFTIYGALILSMRAFYAKANVKITVFMIVSNFMFLVVFAIDTPILLGYILGWDLCGFFYGQARVSILLINPLVFAASISYILFVPARFKQFYSCCSAKPVKT